MSLDSFKLIEGSVNYNIVATTITSAQVSALTTLETGEIIYVTDGTYPGLKVYSGTAWIPLGTSAANIPFAPTGGIAAATIQTAIAELDTEKAAISSLATVATSGSYTDLTSKPDLTLKADLVSGKVPTAQLPDTLLGQMTFKGTLDLSTTQPPTAATGNNGWYYVVSIAGTSGGTTYAIGDQIVSNGTAWTKIGKSANITSVNGYTGIVVLAKSDVGLTNADNTSDVNKPVSTAQQAALDLKATKSSPAFTGNVTATGTVSDSLGNLRSLPQNLQTAAYILASTDAGKHISITTGGVTIPTSVFVVGDSVVIYNDSSASQPITCSALTAYISGTNAVKASITLAARGIATIMCYKTNEIVISGDVS
jgi:hypothetical protein